MNRRQKIIVSVTGIFLVLLILVGLTYAYFLTQISGNENTKSISVSTANLAIVYGNDDGSIIGDGETIIPGTTFEPKTFTVTNNGNATTDYVVVIENVLVTDIATGSTTTFESNDFTYTLTCESGCNSVEEFTTLPLNDEILVGNSIDVGETQTYSFTLTYKDTGTDQSNDMNKSLEARINIADISTINPYKNNKNSLAYNIINNAIQIASEQQEEGYAQLHAMPLSTPAQESTMLYSEDLTQSIEDKNYITKKTFTTANASKYYITYGDTYNYSSNYTIINEDGSALQAVKYSEGYAALIGKYIVSPTGSTSTTPVSASNKSTIYYVINATAQTMEYISLNNGLKSNEKYITYGESYTFDKLSGTYTINNPKTIKYNEGYNELIGKYIVSTSGATAQIAADASNLESIYLVAENSSETIMKYKTLTKQTTEDSYKSIENTLSITKDEYGTSYYYRGAVKNNYLEFNGMCWRIVRIEGDGSIKITLAAQKACSQITAEDTGSAFIGTGDYGYTSDSYYDYENSLNSEQSMKYIFDEWFNTNFSSVLNKLQNRKICMGDLITKYDSNGNILTTYSDSYIYSSWRRLYGVGVTSSATLKCNEPSTITDKLLFPLAADEVTLAGGKAGKLNYSYYLRDNASANSWWTITPARNASGRFSSFYVTTDGTLAASSIKNSSAIRPSVSLISGIQYKDGNGTINNPYVVE